MIFQYGYLTNYVEFILHFSRIAPQKPQTSSISISQELMARKKDLHTWIQKMIGIRQRK